MRQMHKQRTLWCDPYAGPEYHQSKTARCCHRAVCYYILSPAVVLPESLNCVSGCANQTVVLRVFAVDCEALRAVELIAWKFASATSAACLAAFCTVS